MTRHKPTATLLWLPLLLLGMTVAPAAANEQELEGYGYFRTVEGTTRLTTFDEAEPIEIEPNYPVLTGDRIWVTPGARVEMVLPDRTVARAAGATDLYLESLALSADGDDNAPTVISLLQGEVQFRVADYFAELEATRIDTDNASVFLQAAGSYRILGDESSFTEVVVREGFAEVHTERGSAVVRAGEQAVIDGRAAPRVSVDRAAGLDDLELWGAELDGYAEPRAASAGYVDRSLAYAAAPLDRHGTWVSVGGGYAWQPRVYGHWRPYSDGWWVHTPAGLTWVSDHPWGWVTSHYGSWNYWPGYGWLWHPGAVYSPAWVYWYWGPTHVAWVPVGYYSHYYYGRYGGFGLSFGVYGWAGGSWDYFGYWTFCPVRYFGRRGYHAYWRSGHELSRYGRYRAVPRGVVTADTRPISPHHWGKPTEVVSVLEREADRRGVARLRGSLPDVTSFVARQPDLPDGVRQAVLRPRESGEAAGRSYLSRGAPAGSVRGLADTPSAPWKVPKPLTDRQAASYASRFDAPRDPAVMRGGERAAEVRRSRTEVATPSSVRQRFFDGAPDRAAGAVPDSVRSAEPRGGQEAGPRALPPSGRYQSPATRFDGDRFQADGDDREPVVRRILEGFRSRSPEADGGSVRSAPPASGSSGSVRGSDGQPSPRSASPSAPSPRTPSSRPNSSSPSGRSPSASPSPRSRSSSGSSVRGSSRSRSSGSSPKASSTSKRKKGGGG